ncbi:MAG TPA: uroporphyrinogen-III C-methyltransferase [Chitinophagales bacterium]|jgi:uroporphyrin-III C-methyltransferase|nr:uroporphyrinogen-III C-methyltransferase [Chitinophagales bacterium]
MKLKKLILVGAGPGDPELISYKGIKALQQADVVMYDALVSDELLQHAPNAIHLFCGKRAGTHYMKQEEINQAIVENANKYGIVVRLKGGDPFVFGRGQEEIEFAEQHQIPTEIIPGISSATALATHRKIPLTKRGITESVWVTTGTTSNGELSEDIELAAQSTATVVILMGIGKLAEIINVFKKYKPTTYPIAIIQNGTLPNEKSVCGNLSTIQESVLQENIGSPAVIIVGEVIRCSKIPPKN